MTFTRLRIADWVAFIAALLLLFVTAMDWYSTVGGEEARRIERLSSPSGGEGGQVEREVQEHARITAEGAEQNAWQANALVDRLILVGLLATASLAVAAAFARAADRRPRDGIGLSGWAGIAALATALLVGYRMIEEPGLDVATTIKAGASAALVVLGIIAFASAVSLRRDERDAAAAA